MDLNSKYWFCDNCATGMPEKAIWEWVCPWAGAAISHHAHRIRRVRWIKLAAKGEHYHFHFHSIANAPSCPRSPGKSESIDRLKKKKCNELILWLKYLLSGARCHSTLPTCSACACCKFVWVTSRSEPHHPSEFKTWAAPLLLLWE